MAYQHYRSPFGDTTLTKVFVGGLAWETQTHVMRTYFEQFGHILEAVIITDKITGKSKGYGFVTYRDPESAKRACEDPNPMIDGRRANCNIASLGRPRHSSQGRNQGPNTIGQGASSSSSSSYGGAAQPPPLGPLPPPPPPSSSVMYPPYGYPTYAPDYAYQQAMYNPSLQQPYYNQFYGPTVSTPYYYAPTPRGTFAPPQAQRIHGPSYLYYPTPRMETSTFPGYLTPPPPPLLLPTRHPFPSPSPTGSQTPQNTTGETEGGAVTSESPNTESR
ncbi:hypothetical protein E3N88_44762 [Mikania micrantha]|uniref:RRM domain-containing protein n=1 Tax=Mikania micrantha TaxID=192012 RepID=A0A5N6LB42_9ASTR|nr:hypothetical protein E3N88_44762 [Mikania micrantha]